MVNLESTFGLFIQGQMVYGLGLALEKKAKNYHEKHQSQTVTADLCLINYQFLKTQIVILNDAQNKVLKITLPTTLTILNSHFHKGIKDFC